VEGESLRARLAREGELPVPEAVRLLREVVDALAYAHRRGIVHRDIKPDNILLSQHHAVVTDFGIAKALSAAGGGGTLTGTGLAIGTPAYMAPEQVTGDPGTGTAADLYSFGCLAFELLSGSTPFQGRAMHRIMAAHISEPAPDLLARRPDCPPALGRLVMQCLEKEPENRPRSAADLVRVLENAATPPEALSVTPAAAERKRFPRAAAFVLGALIVLVGAWMLVKPRGAGDGAAPTAEGATLRSIAVLPFANVGGDTADAYFADGVGEELATALSKVPGLRVVARNSTFRSGGRTMDETEAGKALGVDGLIVGSVRRSGSQLRLTARLVRVSDGSIVWSEQYANEVTDVFAVQDSVTRSIVAALRLQLAAQPGGPAGGPAPAERGTSNLAAYDLYLRGQFALHRRNVRTAVDFFRRAIALDSDYARAYAGLSAALVLLPYFGEVHADSVREPAAAAARSALAIDSTLAEAHTSLGLVYMHANQWEESETQHRTAVTLDPTDAAAFVQYGRLLLATGRLEDATHAFERAESLDPFSAVAAAWVSNTALFAGDRARALAAGRRAVALDSNVAPAINSLAHGFLAMGKPDSALLIADRLPPILPWAGIRGYLHAVAGDPAGARRILQQIQGRNPPIWATEISSAWIRFGLGDTAGGLDHLERATELREIWPNWYTIYDQVYDQVRGSARFAAVGRRVGLDVTKFNPPR
jgi:serine/threonine-protein kinase